MKRVTIGLAVWLLAAGTAAAQQRPLTTEDPETLTTGLMLIEAGFDHQRDIFYPLSGLQGNLTRFPTLGISVGIGPIAEIQLDGGLYSRLNVTSRHSAPFSSSLNFTGDTTSDVEDIVVATKIRVLSESPSRPAIGVRFATRLPNASNESGIGLDTQDFYASVLFAKTVQSIRVVGNAGVGILGDPQKGDRQNDVYLYGLSVARAVRQGVELVGELDLRANFREFEKTPEGTESKARMVFGGRITRGTVRVDGGLIVGMTPRDPSVGFTAGLTWVFTAFRIP
jgi:hypothetical protein